jgi:hypothetical protein
VGSDFKRFGKTGQFPQGKVCESDEGELTMGVAADIQQRTVVLNFGTPVLWLGLPPAQARELAASLIEKADEVEKRGN